MGILSRTLAALSCSIISSMAIASPVYLGDAGEYTMLALGGVGEGSLIVGAGANITGNVGARWFLNLAPGVVINGDVDAGILNKHSDVIITGDVKTLTESKWQGLHNELVITSDDASSLDGKDLDGIYVSTTLSSYDYLSVFNINGELMLDSSESLTLSGNANNKIIINVSGLFKFSSGASIVLDGFKAENVLFNFTGTGFVETGGSILSGTFLGLERHFSLGDGATLLDTRFLGKSMSANAQTVIPPSKLTITSVGGPSATLLILVALAGLLRQRTRAAQVLCSIVPKSQKD